MTDTNTNGQDQNIEESMEELEPAVADAASDDMSRGDADDVVFDEDAELGNAEVVKKLRARLKTAVEEKQAYLNNWQRDKAEFMNARKRDDEARQDFLKFAKQGVIEDLLPIVDSFDMALMQSQGTPADAVSKEWKSGVEGIYKQLESMLARHDVTGFGAAGDAFDPNLHQSISMVPTDDKTKDHTVAEVLQKGYMLSGKVVRPAMVRVYEA